MPIVYGYNSLHFSDNLPAVFFCVSWGGVRLKHAYSYSLCNGRVYKIGGQMLFCEIRQNHTHIIYEWIFPKIF